MTTETLSDETLKRLRDELGFGYGLANETSRAVLDEVLRLRAERLEGEMCEFCEDPPKDTFWVCGRCYNKTVNSLVAERDKLATGLQRAKEALCVPPCCACVVTAYKILKGFE